VLRRAENVQVLYKRDLWGLLTGRHKMLLQVGKQTHVSSSRFPKSELRAMEARSHQTPVRYMRIGERTYWRFAGKWHTDNENLDSAAVHALLVTRHMRQADQIARAKTIAAQGRLPQTSRRAGIPDDVKMLVWNRDGGACRACGSTTELQFDHVIPVAHGGGGNEANIQILCGPCNRRKSAGLTVGATSTTTPVQPEATPPADWYPDPYGGSALRYWDGGAWTDHVHKPDPANT
jgi:5-methylcytosine-specific restriction endonuclease McrA